jgi:hypothetical protein
MPNQLGRRARCPSCGSALTLGQAAPASIAAGPPPLVADLEAAPRADDNDGSLLRGFIVFGAAGAVLFVLLGVLLWVCLSSWESSSSPGAAVTPSEPNEPTTPKTLPPLEKPKGELKKPPGGGRIFVDTAVFLGSEGQGQRFCIIADTSGSMKGAPLEYVKKEIVKSLSGLKEESQFYVIFFGTKPRVMPSATWLSAGKSNVDKIAPWVQAAPPAGSTQPLPAFQLAFRLNPRPDVIFFMTDGLIPAAVPSQVAALNQQEPRVVVNAIMFNNILGTPQFLKMTEKAQQKIRTNLAGAEKQLRQIADQSGGTYRLATLTGM